MGRRTTKRPVKTRKQPVVGKRLSELDKIEDLSAADRRTVERIMREAERLEKVDLENLIVVSKTGGATLPDPRKPVALKATDVSKTITDALEKPVRPGADQLKSVTGSMVDTLRKKFPGVLPEKPLKVGEKGAELPINTSALTKLIRVAAVKQSQGQATVIWDDGINQLIVHPGRMMAGVTEGRIRIDIPVQADGLRASMQVPFSVGSQRRKSGLVMATLDRPAGNATVARIWGDALIALAHGVLVEVAENIAGASGRDTENKRLMVRGLVAQRGSFTIETQAGATFKRVIK